MANKPGEPRTCKDVELPKGIGDDQICVMTMVNDGGLTKISFAGHFDDLIPMSDRTKVF